jgi:hypothetical protein
MVLLIFLKEESVVKTKKQKKKGIELKNRKTPTHHTWSLSLSHKSLNLINFLFFSLSLPFSLTNCPAHHTEQYRFKKSARWLQKEAKAMVLEIRWPH